MSSLTNERLEEIASGQNTVSIPEAVELARELREARAEIERLKDLLVEQTWRLAERNGEAKVNSSIAEFANAEIQGQANYLRSTLDKLWESRCTEIQSLQSQIATLTAELAALKSCPSMAEVDALAYWPDHEFKSQQYPKVQQLADIARRSIVAREEVVGQLDHILSCIITVRQENTPEWMEYIVEEVNKVNEAMGDPDRVSLRFGGIVIVKGDSEIVEGK